MQIEHRRRALDEGKRALLIIYPTSFVLIAGLWFFHGILHMGVFFHAGCGIVLFVAIGVTVYAISNIRIGGIFFCRLDEKVFEQHTPVRGFGDSFRAQLHDIIELERCERSDTDTPSYEWFIRTNSGQCFLINNNYGNPAGKFAECLRATCPQVKYSETKTWARRKTLMENRPRA